jgi:hypothetical protein
MLLLLLQVLVERPLPPGLDVSRPWRALSGDREVPVQVRNGRLLALLPSREAELRTESAAPAPFPAIEVREVEPGRWEILAGGQGILRYHAVEEAQARRQGFIYPLWTPGDREITGNSPPHHRHHAGIWSGWKVLETGGAVHDAWQFPSRTARMEAMPPTGVWGGPVAGGFTARHRIRSASGALLFEETWTLKAWSLPGLHVLDLVSTGVGFRGPLAWEGAKGLECLTSEGKGREEGQGTKPAWVRWSGAGGSVTFINPGAPVPVRIHPDEPFFNWAVPAAGDVRLEPGKDLVQSLRLLVADGPLEPSAIEALR